LGNSHALMLGHAFGIHGLHKIKERDPEINLTRQKVREL